MVFRRSVLDELGEVFPPELDAGTPTECGGDTYALYRILAGGHRIVYDPGTSTSSTSTGPARRAAQGDSRLWHRAFRRAREAGAGGTRADRAQGVEWALVAVQGCRSARAGRWRIRWRFGSAGTTSRAAFSVRERMVESEKARPRSGRRADHPADRPTRLHGGATAPAERGGCRGLRDRLRLERARGASPLPRGACASEPTGLASETIVTGTGGLPSRNAAAASARGEILLFVDAELVPQRHFVAAHLERHRFDADERVVIGRCAPRAAEGRLAELYEKLRWDDHFERKRTAPALTFADFLAMNMSVPRKTFERFCGSTPASRKLAAKAGSGASVCSRREWRPATSRTPSPPGCSRPTLGPCSSPRAARARRTGCCGKRHPGVAASLALPGPARLRATLAHPVEGLASFALRRHGARRAVAPMLDGLELLRARQAWLRMFERTRRAAYEEGVRSRAVARSKEVRPSRLRSSWLRRSQSRRRAAPPVGAHHQRSARRAVDAR